MLPMKGWNNMSLKQAIQAMRSLEHLRCTNPLALTPLEAYLESVAGFPGQLSQSNQHRNQNVHVKLLRLPNSFSMNFLQGLSRLLCFLQPSSPSFLLNPRQLQPNTLYVLSLGQMLEETTTSLIYNIYIISDIIYIYIINIYKYIYIYILTLKRDLRVRWVSVTCYFGDFSLLDSFTGFPYYAAIPWSPGGEPWARADTPQSGKQATKQQTKLANRLILEHSLNTTW